MTVIREATLVQPRLNRQLIVRLVEAIAVGTYAPGQLLPREADLSERYGVSRGVVREAIRALEERGLVSVRHGHGSIVRPSRDWNILDADVLSAVLESSAGVEVLREVVEMRRILEVEAAGLAAERAGQQDVASLEAALARMEELVDRQVDPGWSVEDPFLDADRGFHEVLMAASGNRALFRLAEPLQRSFLAARRPLAHPEDRVERAIPQHRAILEAVARRDRDGAQRAMREVFVTLEAYLAHYTVHVEGSDAAQTSRS